MSSKSPRPEGGVMLWKSRSRPLLAPRLTPHRCRTRLISLLDFLPCSPSFPLVTCRRHSSYLAPCATSTRYRAISHRRDSFSATLSSALYIQPMYLLYLVRFELVGLYTACTSHIPLSLRAILHYSASVPWCCDISSNLLSTSLSSSTFTLCSPLDTSSAEHRHFSPRPPLDPHLGPSADKALAAQPHLGDRQPTRSPPARPTPFRHRHLVTLVATDAVGSRNTTNSSTTLATPTPA